MASAYENNISIIITAIDQASEVLAEIQAQVEEAQKTLTETSTTTNEEITGLNDELSTNYQEMADSVDASLATITDAQTQLVDFTTSTTDEISGLNSELSADYQTMTDEVKASLGELVVANSDLVTSADSLVADIDSRNSMIIASYTAMKDSIVADMTEIDAAQTSSAAVADTTGGMFSMSSKMGSLGLGGLGNITGLSPTGNALLAGATVGLLSLKAAADFQSSATRLYTTAGETANMQQLMAGISHVSTSTGEGVLNLTSGTSGQPGAMYYISSSGFNNLKGLQVLNPVAQASAMEGANPADVANALTTMMRDYAANPSQATSFMNMMLTAVSHGKTTLQQTATALPTFLTSAALAHLTPANALSYYSTLTASGVSSQQSGQDVNALIRELSGGFTTPESTAIQNLGLNPFTLQSNLGKVGLGGTVNEIEQAILGHMKNGTVLLSAYQNSTIAQQNLQTEMAAAPAQVQALARQLIGGSLPMGAYRQYSYMMPGQDQAYAKQILTTYEQANSFNKLLSTNKPLQQTYLSENQRVFGQGNARNAAVIGEQHYASMQKTQQAIQQSSDHAGKNVQGWTKYISTFSAQMRIFWENIQNVGREIGSVLLPPLTEFLKLINDGFKSGVLVKIFEVMLLPIALAIQGLVNLVTHWQLLVKAAGDAVSFIARTIRGWWSAIVGDLDHFGMMMENWFTTLIDNIVKNFTNLPGQIGSAIAKGAKGLAKNTTSMFGTLGKDVGGLFTSIAHLASGTESAQGGLTLVGEQGPELVMMPQGARVYNNSDTSAMLNRGTGGTGGTGQATTVHLNVNVGSYLGTPTDRQALAKTIYQSLQNIARQHGAASALPNIGILPQ